MLLAMPPFYDDKDCEVVNKIRDGKINTDTPEWNRLSPESRDLISKMVVNQSKRLSAKQVLEHPWMICEMDKRILNTKLNTKGIMEFFNGTKLKKMAMSAVAFNLSDHEIQHLGKVFTQLDKDGDGQLSYDELTSGLRNLGPNFAEVLKVYEREMKPTAKIRYNGKSLFNRIYRFHDGVQRPAQRRVNFESCLLDARQRQRWENHCSGAERDPGLSRTIQKHTRRLLGRPH